MTRLLAIDGGQPLRSTPMPPWPAPGAVEIEAVSEVLRSGRINYWTGSQGRLLESEYAAHLGRSHAIALTNGTVALELALRAFLIGPGDEVIVPSRTFIATAGAVVAVGARPVIADIDPDSGTMTAETVAAVLTHRTKAIIPVHMGGWPANMTAIAELAATRDLVVIEDCAQAHGASLGGRPAGALASHAAAFSFCQDKIIPAGEGGLLVLDDDEAYQRAWAYKEHGKSLPLVEAAAAAPDTTSYRWLVEEFGTNWRMSELVAAVARVGLSRLPEWHAARNRNATRLAAGLRDTPGIRVPLPADGVQHAFYRLYAFVEPEALAPGWTRDRIIRAMVAEGVPCQYGTCALIGREAAFAAHGIAPAHPLPGAQRAHETSLSFFVHPTLTTGDLDDTISAVNAVMEVATS